MTQANRESRFPEQSWTGLNLRITSEPGNNGGLLLHVQGEVDLSTVDLLDEAMTDAIDQGAEPVVVDLREVAFMDSTGLRAMLRARNRAHEQGGSMKLLSPSHAVSRLLALSGVEDVFDFDGEPSAG
jgi:anti-sigma B factor antagonist